MDQYTGPLIGQYRSRGIFVDTNVLLLYFVGVYDPSLVEIFPRTKTRGFTSGDFRILARLLGQFDRLVITPHVLTEVNNWLAYLKEPAKSVCLGRFAKAIGLMNEKHTPASDLSSNPEFVSFGITDTAIVDATPPGAHLVLTDDFRLYGYLISRGVDAINFNHIRQLG